jgi:hypothetical protein
MNCRDVLLGNRRRRSDLFHKLPSPLAHLANFMEISHHRS